MKLLIRKERILWLSLVIIVTFSGYCSGHLREVDTEVRDEYMSLLKQAYHHVRKRYPDRKLLSSRRLIYSAIDGAFNSLGDPHSTFLNERDFSFLESSMTGAFAGIGISLSRRDGHYIILYTLPKSPARKAKLRSRDRLIEVNGKPVKNVPFPKLVTLLRGKANSKVRLTVLRGDNDQRITATLKREIIGPYEVEVRILKKKIAYIRLHQFSNISSERVKQVLLYLKAKNIKGIIFDLRGNPGGELNNALYIINFFLGGDKRLASVRSNIKSDNRSYSSDSRISIFPDPGVPLAVLADNRSASASEMFIGAMQDHKRGVIVGSKTYGKGSVQIYQTSRVFQKVAFKVTQAKWYTPKGRAIDHKGLVPDIPVPKPRFTLEDKYYISKLLKSRIHEGFVKSHPKLKKSEIKEFVRLARSKGIRLKKKYLVRYLKAEKYLFSPGPILDMSYDRVLRKAHKYLTHQINQ